MLRAKVCHKNLCGIFAEHQTRKPQTHARNLLHFIESGDRCGIERAPGKKQTQDATVWTGLEGPSGSSVWARNNRKVGVSTDQGVLERPYISLGALVIGPIGRFWRHCVLRLCNFSGGDYFELFSSGLWDPLEPVVMNVFVKPQTMLHKRNAFRTQSRVSNPR